MTILIAGVSRIAWENNCEDYFSQIVRGRMTEVPNNDSLRTRLGVWPWLCKPWSPSRFERGLTWADQLLWMCRSRKPVVVWKSVDSGSLVNKTAIATHQEAGFQARQMQWGPWRLVKTPCGDGKWKQAFGAIYCISVMINCLEIKSLLPPIGE